MSRWLHRLYGRPGKRRRHPMWFLYCYKRLHYGESILPFISSTILLIGGGICKNKSLSKSRWRTFLDIWYSYICLILKTKFYCYAAIAESMSISTYSLGVSSVPCCSLYFLHISTRLLYLVLSITRFISTWLWSSLSFKVYSDLFNQAAIINVWQT